MGVGEDFRIFCDNLRIGNRETISQRYKRITKRLNLDFWGTDSDTKNSFYAGSYGRGTAIHGVSDLDMVFELPSTLYSQYNSYVGNGQSALLQAVRSSLMSTYSNTAIGGDGQVVGIAFSDGVTFEIVPAFLCTDGTYKYPDSNNGGMWKHTNPKTEISTVALLDGRYSGNFKWLCRMARAWKEVWNVPIGGLLIDTLAARFLADWEFKNKSFLYYDWMSRDFFNYLAGQQESSYWYAIGSNQKVYSRGAFQYKAKRCCNLSIEAIDYCSKDCTWSSRKTWRQIYGNAYPG